MSEELSQIKDYVILEKMRFHETLEIDITEQIDADYQIAPMLLIPFVENSFKHGQLSEGKLKIYMKIETDEEKLIFRIKNSIQNSPNKRTGIGLENTEKRLDILYPNQYHLDINQTQNEYEVILKLYKNDKKS